MCENQRMIHGDIRRALLKVAYGITARGHHIAQQLMALYYRAPRPVNEPRLDSAPSLDKPGTVPGAQRTDVQTLHPVRALVERCFRFAAAPALVHCAGLFIASKLSAQPRRSALANQQPTRDADDHHHRSRADEHDLCGA